MITRFIFWMLLLLIALAPLPFGSNRPWAWTLLATGAGTLLVLWAIAAAANPALCPIRSRHYRWPLAGLALFALWTLFQTVPFSPAAWHHPSWTAAAEALDLPLAGAISVAPDDGRMILMRLLSYAAIFWLAMQLGRRRERAYAAWWSISLAATAYAIYGLAIQLNNSHTILWFQKWGYYDALTATFVNRNHFATYAGIGLVVTLALLAGETKDSARHGLGTRSGWVYFLDHVRPPIFILMGQFVILTTALLLTGSRAGVFSTMFGILALLGAFAISQGPKSRSLIGFGAIVFLVGFTILLFSGDAISVRLSGLIENAMPREKVYALTWQAIAERPALGTGLGSFAEIFRLKRGDNFGPNEATYDVAHNSYLELLLEAGLPAAILLYAALALVLLAFLHGARNRRRDVIFPCGGLAASALVGVHALVDFSLQIPAVAATFALIAGIAYAQSWRHDERVEQDQVRE